MSMETLFVTLIIDTLEERDTAIFDVPGAYLHADIPTYNIIILILRDEFFSIMCKVNLEHKKNFKYNNVQRLCNFMWLEQSRDV